MDPNRFGFLFVCWDAGVMYVGVVPVMNTYVLSWVGCLVSQRVGGTELLWLTLCIPVGVPEGWLILICFFILYVLSFKAAHWGGDPLRSSKCANHGFATRC